MTSAAQVPAQQYPQNVHRFDFRRDMFAVADLIELCFADRLDEDGQRLIRQFRSAARTPRGFTLGISTPKQFPLTLAGFVWRENSSLIGNLNLVPIRSSGERAFLIANVAVHPEHRRKGIARALTDATINYLMQKQVAWCWLQVDDDNQPAINLYEQTGFSEQVRTTTWQCDPLDKDLQKPTAAGNNVNAPTVQDWEKQQTWLNQTYPPNMGWHLPLNYDLLKPGLQGSINRLISDKQINQWAARDSGNLIGVLSRQSSSSQADKLWLAATPENDQAAIEMLISHARRSRPRNRKLALEYPSGRAVESLTKAGFYNHQTLIWMRCALVP